MPHHPEERKSAPSALLRLMFAEFLPERVLAVSTFGFVYSLCIMFLLPVGVKKKIKSWRVTENLAENKPQTASGLWSSPEKIQHSEYRTQHKNLTDIS